MKHLKRTIVAAVTAVIAFGAAGQALAAPNTEQQWRDCKAKAGQTTKSCCTKLNGTLGSELKWNPYKEKWESVPTCTINGTVYTIEGTDDGSSGPSSDYHWYDGSSSGTYQQSQPSSTSTTRASSGTYSYR